MRFRRLKDSICEGSYESPEESHINRVNSTCLTSLDHIVLYGNPQAINL